MPQFEWLEEVHSERALTFAKEQSDRTLNRLVNLPYFSQMQKDAEAILNDPNRVPAPQAMLNGYIYNVWQDDRHVQGLWRRAKVKDYFSSEPQWEVLLDLDELSKAEGKKWVWNGARYNEENMRTLVFLSNGGEDAKEIREYDLVERRFVEDGFFVPRSKSSVAWYNSNTIFYSPAFNENELTSSGYPRTVRLLSRGESLTDSKFVFEGEASDWACFGQTVLSDDRKVHFIVRGIGMNEYQSLIIDDQGVPKKLTIPSVGSLNGISNGKIIFSLEAPWEVDGRTYSSGSLLAIPLIGSQVDTKSIEVLFEGKFGKAVVSAAVAKNIVWVNIIDNIQTYIRKFIPVDNGWKSEKLNLPELGTCSFAALDRKADLAIITFQNFTQPRSYYLSDSKDLTLVKQMSKTYDEKEVKVHQYWATSKDGTKVPYFQIAKNAGASLPSIVYGYGGYNQSLVPYYLNETGKLWIEDGGAWIVANIRGGGEMGPQWHLDATRKNKQKSYDDFIAVARDLIERGLATPSQLGIFGGSNGGLLVGAAFTQRPDLFNAVVCSVPLLDMLRYHKLPPGASWIREYGNPDDPEFADVISRYSPYHNLSEEKKYPEVFFNTSTKDDRVHPGHARKMVAKMVSQGHPVMYFENQEGGHAGAANQKQRAFLRALEFSYFRYKLMGDQ